MSYVILVVGAMGISSAMYVITDLANPYTGIFVVSPTPLINVLNIVEEAAALAGGHR